MSSAKDSVEVIQFMVLFQKLKGWIDDEPNGLTQLAAEDEVLERLCIELGFAANLLSMNDRRHRQLFLAPADPAFIEAWREYREKYASTIGEIFLSSIGIETGVSPAENKSRADLLWEVADDDAKEQANAIGEIIHLAEQELEMEGREWADGYRERLEDGVSAWARLTKDTGFDLREIFRRRELVPFVLIPTHVSKSYGSNEKLSLLTYLQQAHDAFIFGVPFAAIALMRSVLETTLKFHYPTSGDDLNELIKKCRDFDLPPGASRAALHRLRIFANDVLHFTREGDRLTADFEKEMLSLLMVLRNLIEGAPSSRRR